MLRECDIFRDDAFRKNFEAELNCNRGFFAARIEVKIEIDFRTGLDQTPGVRRKDISVLAQCIFVEKQTNRIVFLIFDQIRREVMDDFVTLGVGRFAFDGHDIHVFGETGIDKNVHDVVWTVRRQNVGLLHGDDAVRLPDVPLVEIIELAGRRHVGRVAQGRAAIHPFRDGRDFRVAQRRIIFELADADISIDVPRRHFPPHHLLLHCTGPRPSIVIS